MTVARCPGLTCPIGILAAVALPAYQDYTIRAKMSEVVLALSSCRTTISEVYQSGGTPPGAGAWGCEGNSSKYVQGISTDANGVATAVVRSINADIDGSAVSLSPMIGGAAANASTMMGRPIDQWRCGPATSGGLSSKYLPSSCRGQ